MADPLPLNVSPLIKTFFDASGVKKCSYMLIPTNLSRRSRWTLLISGIVYGFSRYNFLMSRERKRLAELERTRPEREAKAAEEKRRMKMAEIEELEKLSRGSK